MATARAAEQISATLGSEVFHGDAHALLTTVYKDPKQPIGLRIEAAKAALPYEKPRLASSNENKIVDEFDGMSDQEIEAWLDERAEARVKMRHRDAATSGQYGRQPQRERPLSKLDHRIGDGRVAGMTGAIVAVQALQVGDSVRQDR
jgi:hypothetical protein